MREFGVILVDTENQSNLQKICDIVFDFQSVCFVNSNSIICDLLNGNIHDNLYTKKLISTDEVKFNFNILKDILINNNYVFCDLDIKDISEICEKFLYRSIDNYLDAYEIFTKDYFDVKIPLL
ncbi:hypothetical protein ACAG39_09790 [Caldicellulosiruptoraceae bacterium PP1]